MLYEHKKIEPKWQKKWRESGVFEYKGSSDPRPKYYMLDLIPTKQYNVWFIVV